MPQWQRHPESLRDHLTRDELDASRDALARFVGLEAYEAAGGGIRRDLFADKQKGVLLTDAGLLEKLARDRLADTAESVRAEGWGWVEVTPRVSSAELHTFQRARRSRREPTKAEAKRIEKLEADQARLQNKLDDEDDELSDDGAQALQGELDRLGDQLDAIDQTLVVYDPGIVAMAGAVVSVDPMGAVVVHRGLLREEQVKALRAQERPTPDAHAGGEGDPAEAPTSRGGLSEKLVRRLSAHRTAALQAEVARHPRIALVALVHQLVQRVIHGGYGASPINISAAPQDRLDQHAPDVAQAPAALGLRAVREAWASRLPEDPTALFAELQAMEHEELLSLLALCVGLTISAISQREDETPAALLAQAVGLDMHSWWMPTAAGYFDHVSKARALEAVQVFAPGEVQRLAKLKKAQITSEAERLAAGSGWLPQMLTEPVQAGEALDEHEPEDHEAA